MSPVQGSVLEVVVEKSVLVCIDIETELITLFVIAGYRTVVNVTDICSQWTPQRYFYLSMMPVCAGCAVTLARVSGGW